MTVVVVVVMKMVMIRRRKGDGIQETKQYKIKREIMTVTANYLEILNKNYSEVHNVS
jgi:septum formation topological specificity factor MinE